MEVIDDAGIVRVSKAIDVIDDKRTVSPPYVVFKIFYKATEAYNIAMVRLIGFDGTTEYIYFEYTISPVVAVAPEYGVRIDYQITCSMTAITAGTTIWDESTLLPERILRILIGRRTEANYTAYLNIGGLLLFLGTTLKAEVTAVEISYDTVEDKAWFKGEDTWATDFDYDRPVLMAWHYNEVETVWERYRCVGLIRDVADTIYANVTYTFYFYVSI